jgi:acyl-CoA synthetase (AMP-forming)/AMP-acid ligase II
MNAPACLPAVLRDTARRYPDHDAVVDGTVRMTYGQYDAAVLELARAAIGHGVRRGDRVAIWSQNSWQWCVAALGLQAAGAAIVPVNTRFSGREAAQVLHRSGARALLATRGFLGKDYPGMLHDADPSLARLPVIIMDGDPGPDLSWRGFLDCGRDVSDARALAQLDSVGGQDIADIVFTSGSTASPRGVVQPHSHVLIGMTALSRARTLCSQDRSLVLAPLFAQFGLRGLAADIICGATTVVQSVFDPARLFELLERERITDFAGPPTLMAALLTPAASKWDLSSLRVALIGSTTVPPELVRSLLENRVFEHVFTAWGLTEACGAVTIVPAGDDIGRIAGTSGKPLEHVQLRAVKEDGSIARPGEQGELQVKSTTNMLCYLDEPELTQQTLLDGGWLRTGDIGLIDEQGYVRITDRLKDMLMVGGFGVASAEVEAVLRTHPDIREAAVVGRPDERLGEVGVAFLVPETEHEIDSDAVIAWCRGAMANYKAPQAVHVLDALPLNASLKVDKILLRDKAASF